MGKKRQWRLKLMTWHNYHLIVENTKLDRLNNTKLTTNQWKQGIWVEVLFRI